MVIIDNDNKWLHHVGKAGAQPAGGEDVGMIIKLNEGGVRWMMMKSRR